MQIDFPSMEHFHWQMKHTHTHIIHSHNYLYIEIIFDSFLCGEFEKMLLRDFLGTHFFHFQTRDTSQIIYLNIRRRPPCRFPSDLVDFRDAGSASDIHSTATFLSYSSSWLCFFILRTASLAKHTHSIFHTPPHTPTHTRSSHTTPHSYSTQSYILVAHTPIYTQICVCVCVRTRMGGHMRKAHCVVVCV